MEAQNVLTIFSASFAALIDKLAEKGVITNAEVADAVVDRAATLSVLGASESVVSALVEVATGVRKGVAERKTRPE